MTPAADVSRYQGTIDWANMPPIAMIKMSGGDDGLYMDSDAASNYTQAKAHGKGVGGYHFIGWTLGASAEATYFLQAMSPLAENDVYALDIEAIKIADPVSYVTEMVDLISSRIGVFPLLYMNLSTLRSYNWSALLAKCGLWLADWNNDPAGTIPNVPIYVMQQYSDGPNYDHDEWFGTIDEFKAYGYHASAQAPVSVSTPEPVQTTTPVEKPIVTTVTASSGVNEVSTSPSTDQPKQSSSINTPPAQAGQPVNASTFRGNTPQKATSQKSKSVSWWTMLWNWIKGLF